MSTYSVLVVDDEPHARRYLTDLVEKSADLQLIGTCSSGREALAFCQNQLPDMLFLDIQMPGMTGIEVAQKLKNKDTLIIFSTAYDQYAINAFELAAQDYLLKPFAEDRFNEVVERAVKQLAHEQREAFTERMQRVFEHFQKGAGKKLTQVIIKDKGLEHPVEMSDVYYLTASSVYLIIHTWQKEHLYRTSLNLLEQQLPPSFVRIHRSIIINTDHLVNHRYLNNNTFEFEMPNGKKVVSSRSYKNAISQFLKRSKG